MPNIYEGHLTNAQNDRYGIVVSRFNAFINEHLLNGALDGLRRHGVEDDRIDVVWVPGAFEIPVVAKRMAENNCCDAVIWQVRARKARWQSCAPISTALTVVCALRGSMRLSGESPVSTKPRLH